MRARIAFLRVQGPPLDDLDDLFRYTLKLTNGTGPIKMSWTP